MDQKQVLLIENHPVLRLALQQLLCSAGYAVMDEVTDIVDGVCQAVLQQPAFVILDSSIAELNGKTFSVLIHRLAPDCKVILLVDDALEYCGLTETKGTACVTKRAISLDLPSLLHQWSNAR